MASDGNIDSREKDFGNGGNAEHLGSDTDRDTALHKIRTAGAISISPELFEQLYLQPRVGAGTGGAGGAIRKAVGNPTPLGLVGFLLSLTPLTCDLMNWRDASTGNGAASIGVYFGMGAFLMILSSIQEWIVGNTFPAVVFGSFGGFWFAYAATLDPYFGVGQVYADAAKLPAAVGEVQPAFLNSFGFFLLWMGVLCVVYLIAALRTNVVFVVIFFCLIPAFSFLTAGFWKLAEGDTAMATHMITAGGAFAFVVCCAGWYIFASLVFASVAFPVVLPLGDLSHILKGKGERDSAA